MSPTFAQKQESRSLNARPGYQASHIRPTSGFESQLDASSSASQPPVSYITCPGRTDTDAKVTSSHLLTPVPNKMGPSSRHRQTPSLGSAISYSSLSSHAPKAVLRRLVSPPQPLQPGGFFKEGNSGHPFFIGDRNLRSTSEASSLTFESPPFALSSSANQSPLKQAAELSTNSSTFLPPINLVGPTGGPITFSPSYPRRPSTSYSVATGTDQSSPLMSQDFVFSPELAKVDTRARHASRSGKPPSSIDTALFPDFHPTTLTPELISHFGGIENMNGQACGKGQQAAAQGGAASPLTPSTPSFPTREFNSTTPVWAGMHPDGGESSFRVFQDVPICHQPATKQQQTFVDIANDILSTSPSDPWPVPLEGPEPSIGQPTMFCTDPSLNSIAPQSTLLSAPPISTVDMNNWLQCTTDAPQQLAETDLLFGDLEPSCEVTKPLAEPDVGINPASMMLSHDPIFEQTLLQSQHTAEQMNQANNVPIDSVGTFAHSRHHSQPEFASSDFSEIFVFPQDIEATPDFKRPDDILDYSIPATPAEEGVVGLPESLRYSLTQPMPFEPSNLSAEINHRFGPIPFTFPAREESEQTAVAEAGSQVQTKVAEDGTELLDYEVDLGRPNDEAEAKGETKGPTGAVTVPDDLEDIEGYSCPVHLCGMMFLTNKDYMQHLDVNHGTTPEDLPNFLVRYGIDKASIKKRNADPSKGPSVCWICESRFGRRYDLTRHLATVHATKQSPWSCYYCEPATVLSRSDAQQRHMSTAHPHLADALQRLVMKRKKGRGRKKASG